MRFWTAFILLLMSTGGQCYTVNNWGRPLTIYEDSSPEIDRPVRFKPTPQPLAGDVKTTQKAPTLLASPLSETTTAPTTPQPSTTPRTPTTPFATTTTITPSEKTSSTKPTAIESSATTSDVTTSTTPSPTTTSTPQTTTTSPPTTTTTSRPSVKSADRLLKNPKGLSSLMAIRKKVDSSTVKILSPRPRITAQGGNPKNLTASGQGSQATITNTSNDREQETSIVGSSKPELVYCENRKKICDCVPVHPEVKDFKWSSQQHCLNLEANINLTFREKTFWTKIQDIVKKAIHKVLGDKYTVCKNCDSEASIKPLMRTINSDEKPALALSKNSA